MLPLACPPWRVAPTAKLGLLPASLARETPQQVRVRKDSAPKSSEEGLSLNKKKAASAAQWFLHTTSSSLAQKGIN